MGICELINLFFKCNKLEINNQINEYGEKEIVISDFPNFKELVEKVDKIRKKEEQKNKKIVIKKEIKVENKAIDYPINFSNIVFEEKVILESITFNKNINFNDAEFNKKVTFHHCIFNNNTSFENTEFHKLVDFYDATFKEPQQFHLTDFLDKAIFSDATFEKEAQFLHCKVEPNSYISFQSTKFEKGIDISRSNFNFGKTSFWNINVKDKGLLGEALSSEYYKNDFGDKEILPSVPKKLRESMRFIKNSFYSEGNRIEGSEFEKKELEVYKEEIVVNINLLSNYILIFTITSSIIISIATLLCFFKINISNDIILSLLISINITLFLVRLFLLENYFMLLLNKCSNNFGTSWTKGVIFTIKVGIITYLPIIVPFICNIYDNYSLSINKEGFYNLLKYIGIILRNFIEVINITKWTHLKFFGIEPTNWQYVWLYLGRIFIAYGIYQTIQAFRKYGKS